MPNFRKSNAPNKMKRKMAGLARKATTAKSANAQSKQIATLASTVAKVAKQLQPSYHYMKSYVTGSLVVSNANITHLIRPSTMYGNYLFQRPEVFDSLQGVKIKGIKVQCTLKTNTESSLTQVTTKLIRYNKAGFDNDSEIPTSSTSVVDASSYQNGHDYIPIISRKRIHTLKSRTDYLAEKSNYAIAQGEGAVAQPITNLKDMVKHWTWYLPINTIIKSRDVGTSNSWSNINDSEVNRLSQLYLAVWTDNSTVDLENPDLEYSFTYDLEGRD